MKRQKESSIFMPNFLNHRLKSVVRASQSSLKKVPDALEVPRLATLVRQNANPP